MRAATAAAKLPVLPAPAVQPGGRTECLSASAVDKMVDEADGATAVRLPAPVSTRQQRPCAEVEPGDMECDAQQASAQPEETAVAVEMQCDTHTHVVSARPKQAACAVDKYSEVGFIDGDDPLFDDLPILEDWPEAIAAPKDALAEVAWVGPACPQIGREQVPLVAPVDTTRRTASPPAGQRKPSIEPAAEEKPASPSKRSSRRLLKKRGSDALPPVNRSRKRRLRRRGNRITPVEATSVAMSARTTDGAHVAVRVAVRVDTHPGRVEREALTDVSMEEADSAPVDEAPDSGREEDDPEVVSFTWAMERETLPARRPAQGNRAQLVGLVRTRIKWRVDHAKRVARARAQDPDAPMPERRRLMKLPLRQPSGYHRFRELLRQAKLELRRQRRRERRERREASTTGPDQATSDTDAHAIQTSTPDDDLDDSDVDGQDLSEADDLATGEAPHCSCVHTAADSDHAAPTGSGDRSATPPDLSSEEAKRAQAAFFKDLLLKALQPREEPMCACQDCRTTTTDELRPVVLDGHRSNKKVYRRVGGTTAEAWWGPKEETRTVRWRQTPQFAQMPLTSGPVIAAQRPTREPEWTTLGGDPVVTSKREPHETPWTTQDQNEWTPYYGGSGAPPERTEWEKVEAHTLYANEEAVNPVEAPAYVQPTDDQGHEGCTNLGGEPIQAQVEELSRGQKGRSVTVRAQVAGRHTAALVDTGAYFTLVQRTYLGLTKEECQLKGSPVNMAWGDGGTVKAYGGLVVPVRIGGFFTMAAVVVVEEGPAPVVLGWDFLRWTDARIHCGRQRIYFPSGDAAPLYSCPRHYERVKHLRSMWLRARSSQANRHDSPQAKCVWEQELPEAPCYSAPCFPSGVDELAEGDLAEEPPLALSSPVVNEVCDGDEELWAGDESQFNTLLRDVMEVYGTPDWGPETSPEAHQHLHAASMHSGDVDAETTHDPIAEGEGQPELRQTPELDEATNAKLRADAVERSGFADEHSRQRMGRLLDQYGTVASAIPGLTKVLEHVIELTSDKPITLRPYQHSPTIAEDVKRTVVELLKAGMIVSSNSQYSSPVVVVRKKDGTVRVCIDYRRLNAITRTDRHPMPRVDQSLRRLRGKTVFSSLDLKSGYWQVPVHKTDQPKTAFITTYCVC